MYPSISMHTHLESPGFEPLHLASVSAGNNLWCANCLSLSSNHAFSRKLLL